MRPSCALFCKIEKGVYVDVKRRAVRGDYFVSLNIEGIEPMGLNISPGPLQF